MQVLCTIHIHPPTMWCHRLVNLPKQLMDRVWPLTLPEVKIRVGSSRYHVIHGTQNRQVRLTQKSNSLWNAFTWSVHPASIYKPPLNMSFLHTYLDGTSPFMDPGLWATGAFHSTATLSSEGTCGLYGLRLMHRLNIFPSCHGHSGWAGLSFCSLVILTLTLVCNIFSFAN